MINFKFKMESKSSYPDQSQLILSENDQTHEKQAKLIFLTQQLGLEMIESKINLIRSLTVRFKEVSNLTNSIGTLDFEQIVNERLRLKHELQRHIDDLFNAFKEIRVLALELDLKDFGPNEEEADDMH